MQGPRTAAVLRRFNEAFLRHDPSALPELVAEDCIVEALGHMMDDGRIATRRLDRPLPVGAGRA